MVEALGIDLKEIIFAIANFLILLAVLAKFMYKPFLANLERRKQMIEDAISNAEAVNKRADEKMNSYNKRIAGAEREAAGIINEAKIKADKQASQIIDDANEKAALIMQKAEQEIERQKDAAITEAREQIGMLAVMAAEKIIEKELDDVGQTQIIDSILDEAGAAGWQN
ncbi:MAG: ATP synthase F0 subunit B [Eubacteriales Family XIII. Incertae Sedis bacterium]|nr:MAG: ATP synthase F0 subunit B [Clostridiales Family XIII bacterium]